MATFRAINTTCEAICRLLERVQDPADFNGDTLDFSVYSTDDFRQQGNSRPVGASLYLYRVHVNDVQRTPSGRVLNNGQRQRPKLPVDLSFIITPWANEVSLQLTILGWVMRVLEDYPILTPAMLNTPDNTVFNDDEMVELIAGHISTEDLLRIWDTIPSDYQISVPYVARVLRIESRLMEENAGAVLTKDLGFGVVES